ncbi:maleylpyruvate isomerase N-terminal domain-containing protein [Amycolatopsis nigrescens]|uniref:maleylpyruvate isomerase N-terminal domain-containing protein n=1 Tax=Amycolatopsis nigrescens TaxID=381445 RepID=UPI00035CF1E9|nr:maleylpyruvate isomerase N-terminal domain-containing protein [Amycolatopsis nigrescens]
MTIFGPAIDLRPEFPRERAALLDLLAALTDQDWTRPTVCPGWTVKDITAHILNDYLRRISGSRDGHPGARFVNDETLPDYLARTNEEFVRASRQCSPRVLIDLLTHLGPQLDELWSRKVLDEPADLGVSWADPEQVSPTWLDIARDYTEFWVHQQQIRDAVARRGADEPRLFGPVVDTFLRALPHALRTETRPAGTGLSFEVTGPAGGIWSAVRSEDRWRLALGTVESPAARITMDQDVLWRLASRGIGVEQARQRAELRGDPGLCAAATTLLAIVW